MNYNINSLFSESFLSLNRPRASLDEVLDGGRQGDIGQGGDL